MRLCLVSVLVVMVADRRFDVPCAIAMLQCAIECMQFARSIELPPRPFEFEAGAGRA